MYVRFISILLVFGIAISGMAPTIAGSITPELLDQMETQKPRPKPAEANKDVPILNYLFMGQEKLEFSDETPPDSGLMPASGDDPDALSKPEQKPVLPK